MITTKDKLSITELSKLLNVTDHTIRYYEKEFNLQIPRDSRGRRYYNETLYNTFTKIKQLRDEGVDIKSIRDLLLDNIADESSYLIESSSENYPSVSTALPASGHDLEAMSSSIDYIKTNIEEIKMLLTDIANRLPSNVSSDISASTMEIINELNNHSRKLSDSIETGNKFIESKLENHLERHFNKIDESLSEWRKKNKSGAFRHFFQKIGLVSY